MSNEKKCFYCDGHGEVAPHILDDQPCPVCNGTGKKPIPVSVETSKPADLLKEERIKRAMEALEDLPRFKLSRQELDAAMEAAEYEEIAAQVALPPEKILSINAAQELVDEIKRLKAAHISEVERLTKEREQVLDILWRDIDDLRDPKLTVVQVAAKAANAIHWRNVAKEAAESKLSQLQLANEEKARALYALMTDGFPTVDAILTILNGGQS